MKTDVVQFFKRQVVEGIVVRHEKVGELKAHAELQVQARAPGGLMRPTGYVCTVHMRNCSRIDK